MVAILKDLRGDSAPMRDYQVRMEQAVEDAWKSGYRSPIATLATGLGKTFTASRIMKKAAATTGKRPLFIVHLREIVEDTARRLEAFFDSVCIEMADRKAKLHRQSPIVASIQTLSRRLSDFEEVRDQIGVIIIDECHHATSPSYRKVIEFFKDSPILGLTATPKRTDKVGMHNVFDTVAFKYDICDGIGDGWLVDFIHKDVEIKGINLDVLKTNYKNGDFTDKSLELAFAEVKDLDAIIEPYLQEANDEQGIVFASCVDQSFALAERMNRIHPNMAFHIDSKTNPELRRKKIAEFKAGKIRHLINFRVLTEGFDHSGIGIVGLSTLTSSHSLMTQMIGRGTRATVDLPIDATPEERRRLIANSSKPFCKTISFGTALERGNLVTVHDVLGGKFCKEVEKIAREIEERTPGMTITDRLKYAEALKDYLDDMQDLAVKRYMEAERLSPLSHKVYTTVDYSSHELFKFRAAPVKPPEPTHKPMITKGMQGKIYGLRKDLGMRGDWNKLCEMTRDEATSEIIRLKAIMKKREVPVG